MPHDLSDLSETVTPASYIEKSHLCFPDLIEGANVEFTPISGCVNCPQAQQDGHKSIDGFKIVDDDGDIYGLGDSPYAEETVIRGLYFRILMFQAWLRHLEWWTDGDYSVIIEGQFQSTLYNAEGPGGETPVGANFQDGSDFPVVSASGASVVINTADPNADPRNAIRGNSPIEVGDLVVFRGNNCATDRLWARIKEISGHETETLFPARPSTLTLTLDKAVTPAFTTSRDDDPVSYSVWIGRELTFPPTFAEIVKPDIFFGKKKVVDYTSESVEWASGIFTLKNDDDENTVVCVPVNLSDSAQTIFRIQTKSTGGVWATIDPSDKLFITHDFGAVDHSTTVSTVVMTGLLGSVSILRISYWYESDESTCAVGANRCKFSVPDYGGTWGLTGHDTHGWKHFCSKRNDTDPAPVTDNYASVCYLQGNCPLFAPATGFLNTILFSQVLWDLWWGVPGGLKQIDPGSTEPSNMKWKRLSHPSIGGFFTPKELLTYPNVTQALWDPRGCGNFGYLLNSELLQGMAHAMQGITPVGDPESPSDETTAAALPALVPGWDTKKNQFDNSNLTDVTDPQRDYRRFVSAGGLREVSRVEQRDILGYGPEQYQRLNGGNTIENEEILIPKLNKISIDWQESDNGDFKFINLDADLNEVSSALSVYGALLRINPHQYRSIGRNGIPAFIVSGTVWSITQVGDQWEIECYPDQESGTYNDDGDGANTSWYQGGNICGLPEWARNNNYGGSPKFNSLGPHKGARAGHLITFEDLNYGDTEYEISPMIVEAAPCDGGDFSWLNPETTHTSGDDDYWDGTISACLHQPYNHKIWAYKRDVIRINDPHGYIEQAVNNGDIIKGTEFTVFADLVFTMGNGLSEIKWTKYQTLDWTSLSPDDWVEISPSRGLYAIKKAAVTTIKGSASTNFCIQAVAPIGRISHTYFPLNARDVNDTRKALEYLDTFAATEPFGGGISSFAGGRYRGFTGLINATSLPGAFIHSTVAEEDLDPDTDNPTGVLGRYLASAFNVFPDGSVMTWDDSAYETPVSQSLASGDRNMYVGILTDEGAAIYGWGGFVFNASIGNNEFDYAVIGDFDDVDPPDYVAASDILDDSGGGADDPIFAAIMYTPPAGFFGSDTIRGASFGFGDLFQTVQFRQGFVGSADVHELLKLPDGFEIVEAAASLHATVTGYRKWRERYYMAGRYAGEFHEWDSVDVDNHALDPHSSGAFTNAVYSVGGIGDVNIGQIETGSWNTSGPDPVWVPSGNETIAHRYGAEGEYGVDEDPDDPMVRFSVVGIRSDGAFDVLGTSEEFLADGENHNVDITGIAKTVYENRYKAYKQFALILIGPWAANEDDLDGAFGDVVLETTNIDLFQTYSWFDDYRYGRLSPELYKVKMATYTFGCTRINSATGGMLNVVINCSGSSSGMCGHGPQRNVVAMV